MIYEMLTASTVWPGTPAGVAVRAVLAALTAAAFCLAAGPRTIAFLRALKVGERTENTPIEDEAMRRSIAVKSGTPTMGGVLILGDFYPKI